MAFQKLLMFFLLGIGVESMRKCSNNCSTTIGLDIPDKPLVMIQSNKYILEITTFTSKVKVTMALRKRRSVLLYNVFGSDTEINEDVFDHPDKKEMKEWLSREKCQIGIVCEPNNCWGSDAQKCRDNSLKHWVRSATYHFEGVLYTKDLYRTCIKEWKCWMEHFETDVYIDLHKGPYVRVGQNNTYLSIKEETYQISNNVVVYSKPIDSALSRKQVFCMKYKNGLYCQVKIEGKDRVLNFDSETSCTIFKNNKICTTSSHNIVSIEDQDKSSTQAEAVTKGDILNIEEMIRSSFVESMYNDILLRNMIQNLMEITNNLIISNSRTNPMILHDILGLDVSSHWSDDGIIICPCAPTNQDSCEWTKSNLGTVKHVGHCKKGTNKMENISLYSNATLNTFVPDSFDLRSVGKNILETLEEQEIFNEDKFKKKEVNNQSGYSLIKTITGFESLSNFVFTNLPLLNLILIFIMYIKSSFKY